MSTLVELGWILVGLLLLVGGAEALVRGSTGIARRFGLSELFIGLTIVSFGTSAPELVVSLQAALGGSPEIALGNVVGSNLFNILAILGITGLIRPLAVHLNLIRIDGPILVVVTLGCAAALQWSGLGRLLGAVLVGLLLAYTLFHLWWDKREAPKESAEALAEFEPVEKTLPLWLNALLAVFGLGLLVLGSKWMVKGAVSLATGWGVPEAVIGLTIVAAGTSLPELASSVVAALRGKADIAVGNIVGSNLFNLLGILGATVLASPIAAGMLSSFDLLYMLGATLLLMPVMLTAHRISRAEAGVFLGLYGVYLWVLWP